MFRFLFILSLSAAAAWYVAPGGLNTNNGSQSYPFATLQKAHDAAGAGDTIYMRGGTYPFTAQTNLSKSGSSGRPIRIWAYPGETPVIDGIDQPFNSRPISIYNASFWHIRGLEIKNGAEGGIRIEDASNNIIENCNIHHNGRTSQWDGKGVTLFGASSNNLLLNNDCHHNRDLPADNADGFQVSVTGTGNVLRGNRVWRNSDDGFDLFNVHDNTVNAAILLENNWAWENGYDDNLNELGNGMGFKLGGQRPSTTSQSGGHTVRNCLAWKNLNGGFDDNNSSAAPGAAKPDTLYSNTAWRNPDNYVFWAEVDHLFRNNLSFGNLGHINGSGTYNSWSLAVTVDSLDFLSLDDGCARGPRQADGSLPDCAFLRLVSNSDLINKGIDVGIPYSGSAPDLGAFEYSAADREYHKALIPGRTFWAGPNPFSDKVRFFSRPVAPVTIHDLAGRKIAVCAGKECVWDAENSPAGVYIARARVDGRLMEKRILLVR